MGKTISFRLRKIDSDLEKAIAGMEKEQIADACRNGLRVMLGITTTRMTQTVEKAIVLPSSPFPQKKDVVTPSSPVVAIQTPKPYKPKS
ncbi:MAG TPA: hypothetical protein VEV15_12900 [Flavisolibacter sp.]|nr:hypothetical protein [Flavisolibacter sp.]